MKTDVTDSVISANAVGIARDSSVVYPTLSPFRPSTAHPEIENYVQTSDHENGVYDLVRRLWRDFGLDVGNFSSSEWNPLGGIVTPGDKVLIKPNLVRHIHMEGGDIQSVITHGSVIRCVMDYVALALKGKGEITLGDAPVQSADFDAISQILGLQEICDDVSSCWNIRVTLLDLRLTAIVLDNKHRCVSSVNREGDLDGYVNVDMASGSLLAPVEQQFDRFRVTSYNCSEMSNHHCPGRHEYLISQSVLNSDVVFNVPKLKTHRKVCITASLKNLVGINGHKDWLPHHREGSVKEGGDEYLHPSVLKKIESRLAVAYFNAKSRTVAMPLRIMNGLLYRLIDLIGKDPFREGSWYGNDTAWRMALDLNRLLIYSDSNGKLHKEPQRRVFTVVDSILAGEGEGPMAPKARRCGMVACGYNPLALDTCLASLIGYEPGKIPLIREGYNLSEYRLSSFYPKDIRVLSSDERFAGMFSDLPRTEFNFEPPDGWKGHVEAG